MTCETQFLFVTCCLEESRAETTRHVIANLESYKQFFGENLTVFDNASTTEGITEQLIDVFDDVYVSDRNIGYWSAIHWWLNNVQQQNFTYIIESDMIHYALKKLNESESFLIKNDDVGSVRQHKYEVEYMELYDKNNPCAGSHVNIWQSHVNRVTGQHVSHTLAYNENDTKIYTNNFLTQLPALNRTKTMCDVFDELSHAERFTEFDFQRKYWSHYKKTAIVDGGIFHCDLAGWDSHQRKGVVTGSWTDPKILQRIGYKNTRVATIEHIDSYNVKRYTKKK